jgi:3alpha(or 20beta)-hydroxysteroid dehydrogenase
MTASSQEKSFEGKSVVVTGGGGGIGRALCLALAAEGAQVWVADINEEGARQAAAEVDAAGGTGRAVRLDVSDPGAWQNFARDVEQQGPLHGLVNNAGVSVRVGIAGTSVEDWQRVIGINLSSVFYGMKYLARALADAGSASVVNMSSVWGLMGYLSATYGASKWGVRGLSKTAALEFASQGIRVNSVHPGAINTPLMWQRDEAFINATLNAVPAGRYAAPEELARVIVFLLSDASSYITGTEVVVDGGFSSGGLIHRILAEAKPAGMSS